MIGIKETATYHGQKIYTQIHQTSVMPKDKVLKPDKIYDEWVFADFGMWGPMLAQNENDEILISYEAVD